MKGQWIEWLGSAMKLAAAGVVVLGLYGWMQEGTAKHEAMCDVIETHMGMLEEATDPHREGYTLLSEERREYLDGLDDEHSKAEDVWWDKCSESDPPQSGW